ncbi:non-specific lipid-transfer protein 1-like [Impatiens glandulifera]|uniref:non-specific lipid-transfer protein 1-like n=1 Tax=Impatiens glandulifera TaxID=253017 RepID=UPI001FB18458|nr:non-specific lipid-transfer protein 1-like [Impatiens glandulifera]
MASNILRLFLVVVVAILVGSKTEASVNCRQTIPTLLPCLSFFTGPGSARPSPPCCAAAHKLDQIAIKSTPDRQALCQCLKNVATSKPLRSKINFNNAKAISSLCHLTTTIHIDPNVDCSRV